MKNSIAIIFSIGLLGSALTVSTLQAQESPTTQKSAPQKEAVKKTAATKSTSPKSISTDKATAKVAEEKSSRADRLDLDTTLVTGNRELPKVLYIVPWKKAELGELPAQPFNTLLDEVLQPVDREVFRREVKYYGTVTGTQANDAIKGAAGASQSLAK